MRVSAFDHVAIPAGDLRAMVAFYLALGFEGPDPDSWGDELPLFCSVAFGDNKINLHAPAIWQSERFTLRGPTAKPGCGDFCFVWSGSLDEIAARLEQLGASIEEGPVERVGGRAGGTAVGTSVYTRDPDGNLLEFIVYSA